MNPLSIILGGGVHGKACWLMAYNYTNVYKEIDSDTDVQTLQEDLRIMSGWQWCSGKFSLVGTLAWHYCHIPYRYRGGGGGGG